MKHFYTSLAFKIGAIIVLAEILVLSLVGFICIFRFSKDMDKRIRARIWVPGALMNAELLSLNSMKDKERMEDLVGGEILDALAVNMDGIVIASHHPGRLDRTIADIPGAAPHLFNTEKPEKKFLSGDGHITAVSPVFVPGKRTPRFFLYIKVGTNLVRSEKYSWFLFFLFGSICAVVVTSIIIITIFNLFILKRISGLLKAVQQVKNGNLGVRVKENGYWDEITELQGGINSMTASLQEKIRDLETEIAERKRIQKEYRKAKDEANNANRARSQFIANMSHEIRTPLNAVSGFSELLSAQITEGRQKNYLDGIKTAGKCLLILINDLLDLSKIEAGMMKIRREPVNPRMIFDEIEQIFQVELDAKRLKLIVDIDRNMPATLMFDQTKLRQILVNIMGNAVKFTEKGFVKLSSEIIHAMDAPDRIDLIIYVQDTGIGIPDEAQAAIFESFRQQDGQSTRKYDGAGLGLSISKRLIEMMNGRITVKSKVGKGTTFKIVLRSIAASPSSEDSGENEIASGTEVFFEKATVLVVDDIESDLARTRELLEEMNLQVFAAKNEGEARLLVRERPPDLVIAGAGAFPSDGVDLARKIKENPETRNAPIIALSAPGTSDDETMTMDDPFDGRLPKPVSKHALVSELSLHLNHSESEETAGNARGTPEADKELAIEEIERLPDLMKILREEIAPDLEYLKGVMKMSEIAKKCDRLSALGEEYQARGLVAYAEELLGSTRSFDIANIEKRIVEFPGLMETLEKQNTPPGVG